MTFMFQCPVVGRQNYISDEVWREVYTHVDVSALNDRDWPMIRLSAKEITWIHPVALAVSDILMASFTDSE